MSALRPRLGVVGGLGPLASADFYRKLVELTPAADDAGHLPLALLSLPQIPDRSRAILEATDAPLAALRAAVTMLDGLGVEMIAIVCNSAHHWHGELESASRAEIVHIADCAVRELRASPAGRRVGLLATRGTLASGFYQRRLVAAGYEPASAIELGAQAAIDTSIRQVKAGAIGPARRSLRMALERCAQAGAEGVILACTELPVVAEANLPPGLVAIDSTAALARECAARLGVEPAFA